MGDWLDQCAGLIKVSWKDVRHKVVAVEPTFAAIVDEISPDITHPLFIAYYPYGAIKGDTVSTLFPNSKGGYFRISDADAPKDIVKHLGYSHHFAPFTLLLEKNLELFVDLKDLKNTIPRIVYSPGDFFPFARILSSSNSNNYAPNNVLTMTSGTRSIFMLPSIGCTTHHSNLQRDFNIQSETPKSLYDQWFVFKELVHSKQIQCDWRSCLLYFSQEWLDMINSDNAWIKLKLYLHELAWKYYAYERNHFYYDLSFSLIQKKRNLKPNPYLTDTARHMITTALGSAPGYIPATNDDALPNAILQNIYVSSYGLTKYFPSILQPAHYDYLNDKNPIYYSLQHPSTYMFSPKSRAAASTISEMRELERITRIFIQELAKKDSLCSDTIISKISGCVELNYYHNKDDAHGIIKKSEEVPNSDDRFNDRRNIQSEHDLKFANDAPFLRGCISISIKS
jgi:hypothetical protein